MKKTLIALMAAAALAGCAGPAPADYAAEKPALDLKTYFDGEFVAHGLFTDRSGKVVRRFKVDMTGTWNGDSGTLDERFTYSDGKTERRVWHLTKQPGEGAYFGWWNFATKLNLALAAGLALPLLSAFGYAPGGRGAAALHALTLAYCLLPCLLKLGAAGLLWAVWMKKEHLP